MNQKCLTYHEPVLLKKCIEGLNIHPSGVYVDVTFGGGGHSRGILKKLEKNGQLYGFDQDADAENNKIEDERFTFVRSNFRYISNFMRYHGVRKVDGILADLGVSSHHLDDETRGFSFRFDGKLDMRMNNRAGRTAADVLKTYTEEQLANVFYRYGELQNSRKLAAAIVQQRKVKPVDTVFDLTDILSPFTGGEKDKKQLAQAFQALRIEINQEMYVLRELLTQSLSLLRKHGRLVVISYHSLEDRLVKNFMKTGNFDGQVEQDIYGNKPSPWTLIGRAHVPSDEEIASNPRARSAKLRIAEKA